MSSFAYTVHLLSRPNIDAHLATRPEQLDLASGSADNKMLPAGAVEKIVNYHLGIDEISPFIDEFFDRDAGRQQSGRWSVETANDIQVAFNDATATVSLIRISIDLRYDPEPFLRQLIELATKIEALILDSQQSLFAPELALFVESIRNSDAFTSLENGEELLQKLQP